MNKLQKNLSRDPELALDYILKNCSVEYTFDPAITYHRDQLFFWYLLCAGYYAGSIMVGEMPPPPNVGYSGQSKWH